MSHWTAIADRVHAQCRATAATASIEVFNGAAQAVRRQRLPGPAALVCDREDPGSAARTRCGVPGPDLALGILTDIVTVLAVWTAEADVAAAVRHGSGFVHRTHALPCTSEKKEAM